MGCFVSMVRKWLVSYFIFQIYLSKTNIWSNMNCFERYEIGRTILIAFSVFPNGLDLVICVWIFLVSWYCLESKTIGLWIGICFYCCDWIRCCQVVLFLHFNRFWVILWWWLLQQQWVCSCMEWRFYWSSKSSSLSAF